MSTAGLDDDELSHRLGALHRGPWTRAASPVLQYLTPASPTNALLAGDWNVPMASLRPLLLRADRERESDLTQLFRPHWRDPHGITSDEEMKLRDSFDEALTQLQLTELAVSMGYVPVDAVRADVRAQLSTLLWSTAARRFVQDYDYLSVGYLATRVGVDIGQGDVEPPPVRAAAVRFATVLAEHISLSKDKDVDDWLAFLDDYVLEENEQSQVEQYFLSGRKPSMEEFARRDTRFDRLAMGAQRFVLCLSTMLDVLDQDEQARVGLLYSYWLAKFFGFEARQNGYHEVDEGWAESVAVVLSEVDEGELAEPSGQPVIETRIAVLAQTWDSVRRLVQASRAKRSRRPSETGPAWIQIPGVTEPEFAKSLLNDAGVFMSERPMRPASKARRLAGNVGTVTVPCSKATDVARYLVSRSDQTDRITVKVVGADGKIATRVLTLPSVPTALGVQNVVDQILIK